MRTNKNGVKRQMATIGQKKTAASAVDKIKPVWNNDTVVNAYPIELVQAGAGVPVEFAKKEIRVLTPAIRGSGDKFGFFQYLEVQINENWYGARVMLRSDNAAVTGQEKSATLNFKGATTYGLRVLIGFSI